MVICCKFVRSHVIFLLSMFVIEIEMKMFIWQQRSFFKYCIKYSWFLLIYLIEYWQYNMEWKLFHIILPVIFKNKGKL